MSDVIIDVGKNKTSRINLGIQGENIVEHVIFDISSWVEEYGDGVAFIYAKRRGDEEPYPVALDMDMTEKTATWDVTLTDTAAKGKGSAQLVYVVDEDNDEDFMDDEVKKTKPYATTVQASLVVASEENPSGYETWLEVLGGYTVRVEAAKVAAETAKTAAEAAQAAAEAAQTAAEAAQTAAETAEANAEASEDDAETAATNAATSETNAANSATSAAASASSASTSATNAANSATSASGSASTAQTAATNASQSATAASGSATNAANSASAAATSESNAKDSEDDAEAAASAAATSEANAAASATAASASASSASQSATSASGSASTASTAASTATTKAGEASTSATNAAESASDASDYADAAAQSAEAAAQSAASLEVDTELDDTSTNPVQNKVIKAELDDKANVDGYYESLGAGTADQLASNIYEEDSTPYTFRTSGGSIDIGDRETDMIVGGTIAWNQMLNDTRPNLTMNGITFTVGTNGVVTMNGTATGTARYDLDTRVDYIKGHKYAVIGVPQGGSASTYRAVITGYNYTDTIEAFSADDYYTPRVEVYEGTTVNNVKFNPRTYDLTAMFGTTIADYIYSLEQATAGAGVAYFRKLFPKPYYAYNAGELMSVQVASHDMVGFNQLVTQPTVKPTAVTFDKTKATMVLANTQYHLKYTGVGNGRIVCHSWDLNGNPITEKNVTATGWYYNPYGYDLYGNDLNWEDDLTFNYDSYVMFYYTTFTSVTDMCLNLSWDGERDGEYEPYVKHSYPLDPSLTLRGMPRLDANNNLYYDGDTYASDRTVTRKRAKLVLDGSENWASSGGSTGSYYISAHDMAKATSYSETILCDKMNVVRNNQTVYSNENSVSGYNDSINQYPGQNWLYFHPPTSIVSLQDFKTWLASNPVTVEYELATPTTETAGPYTNPQIVDDFGTEEYVDYAYSQGLRDVSIPVGHYTQYIANLKAKLEMSPNSPDGAGDYIVRQTNGENEYVSLSSNATIQDIIARLEALEGGA